MRKVCVHSVGHQLAQNAPRLFCYECGDVLSHMCRRRVRVCVCVCLRAVPVKLCQRNAAAHAAF